MTPRALTNATIARIAEEHGVTVEEIRENGDRTHRIVCARWACVHALRAERGMSQSAIARALNMHPSSVHYAVRKVTPKPTGIPVVIPQPYQQHLARRAA